ncbi:MAG TPA: hypothetical protein VFV56_10210 [Gaiellaceae bacterium]|jgi:hypothetical protein|nr:hypothetical protein [Gaiellaceae bacterium]
MLGMKSYPREYVDAVRARVAGDADAFATTRAPAALEPVFFRNLLLGLELSFVHRLRTVEGKDGNPLNEVRVVCNSLMLHDGVLTAEKGIKLDPAASVLGIDYGERVVLDAAAFGRLADAFFAELEAKFV